MTRMKIPLKRGARTGTLMKALKANDIDKKWASTPFAKKLVKRETRAGLNDLQRFQVMINRKKRSAAIKKTVKAISKKK